MRHFLFVLALLVLPQVGLGGDKVTMRAIAKIDGALPMSDDELSKVEGSKLFFGSINQPLYYTSISAYLNEVLLTLLGVGGRSPIATYTTVSRVVTPLPAGGITVLLEPSTFVLVKNFSCVGCTKP